MTMENKRSKYTYKALEVLKENGLKLSLEDIADKMGITKKTLYNHFSCKEELLTECMHSFVTDLQIKMRVLYSTDMNAMDCLRRGVEEVALLFQSLSPVFLFDLKKMFPNFASTEHRAGFANFLEGMRENLIKGINESDYRKNIDIELISQYFTYSVFSFFINKVVNNNEFTAKNYFKAILDYHLSAIVSDKGRIYLAK